MIALVYLTASALGGLALVQYYGAVPVMAGLAAVATGLAFSQIHMAIARTAGASATEKALFEMKAELRKLTTRVAEAEAQSKDLVQSFERESANRRETIVSEMRGLEDMITKLGKNFESRLQVVRSGVQDRRLTALLRWTPFVTRCVKTALICTCNRS